MLTPTSQEQPPSPELTPTDALLAIGRGDFTATDLKPLSDLNRSDLAMVRRAWPEFPDASRIRVIQLIAELAENDVRFQFGRALRIALSDPSPVVRQLAIAALWEDEGRDQIETLIEIAQADPSLDVRAEAAQSLGRFAAQAAAEELDDDETEQLRDVLLEIAGDPDAPYILRRRALESVAVFGAESEIVELIRDAYDSDDAGLKAASLYAMGRSIDEGWLEVILHEFDSPDAEMRFEATRASGELGDQRAVLGLITLASDEDAEVRQAAVISLGKIGGIAAVQALRRLSKLAAPADVDAIQEALDEAELGIDALRMRS